MLACRRTSRDNRMRDRAFYCRAPYFRLWSRPSGLIPEAFARHDIDFHFDRIPQHGLDGRARWQNGDILEEFFINGVVTIEVIYVLEMNSRFDDVIEGAAGSLQNLFDLVQCVKRLLFD